MKNNELKQTFILEVKMALQAIEEETNETEVMVKILDLGVRLATASIATTAACLVGTTKEKSSLLTDLLKTLIYRAEELFQSSLQMLGFENSNPEEEAPKNNPKYYN